MKYKVKFKISEKESVEVRREFNIGVVNKEIKTEFNYKTFKEFTEAISMINDLRSVELGGEEYKSISGVNKLDDDEISYVFTVEKLGSRKLFEDEEGLGIW